MKHIIFIICFCSTIVVAQSNQYTLDSLIVLISQVENGKVWTQKHIKFDEYYNANFPSSKQLQQPDSKTIDTTLRLLSKKEIMTLISTLSEYEHQPIMIKLCGDSEYRSFSCEFQLDNKTVINVHFPLSLKKLDAGTIYINSPSGALIDTVSFTIKERKMDKLHKLFSPFVDTTCYGDNSCNGYCFSFVKPANIRRQERWAELKKEEKKKLELEIEQSRIREIRRDFSTILIPRLNHLNSFDKNILSQFKDINSSEQNHGIGRKVISLKNEAEKLNCELSWNELRNEFYFEVPPEIKPVYNYKK